MVWLLWKSIVGCEGKYCVVTLTVNESLGVTVNGSL